MNGGAVPVTAPVTAPVANIKSDINQLIQKIDVDREHFFKDATDDVNIMNYVKTNKSEKPNIIYVLLFHMYHLLKGIQLLQYNNVLKNNKERSESIRTFIAHLDIKPENLTINNVTKEPNIKKFDKAYCFEFNTYQIEIFNKETFKEDKEFYPSFFNDYIKKVNDGTTDGNLFANIFKFSRNVDIYSIAVSYEKIFREIGLYDTLDENIKKLLTYMKTDSEEPLVNVAIGYLGLVIEELTSVVLNKSSANIPISNIARASQFLKAGSYGCVFKPTIPCKDSSKTILNDQYLMKVDKKPIDGKLLEVLKKDRDNKYFIYPIAQCEVKNEEIKNHKDGKYCKLDFGANPIGYYMIDGGKDLTKWSKQTLYDNFPKIMKHLLKAIKILSAGGYIHFDIKPDNIVMGDDLSPKLIDFGITKKYNDPVGEFGKYEDMYKYHPPFINLLQINGKKIKEAKKTPKSRFDEICKEQSINEASFDTMFDAVNENMPTYFEQYVKPDLHKIDIWSLGMTFKELLKEKLEIIPNQPYRPATYKKDINHLLDLMMMKQINPTNTPLLDYLIQYIDTTLMKYIDNTFTAQLV